MPRYCNVLHALTLTSLLLLLAGLRRYHKLLPSLLLSSRAMLFSRAAPDKRCQERKPFTPEARVGAYPTHLYSFTRPHHSIAIIGSG